MNIEYKAVKNALDKDKDILADGVHVGNVSRGWLRNGGEQWVVQLNAAFNKSAFGGTTLRDLKRAIIHKIT